jgi:hypothetical protein
MAAGLLAPAVAAFAQYPQVLQLIRTSVIPDSTIVFSVGNKAPASDAEWATVRKSAENLAATAQKLMPLGPGSNREAWVGFANALGAAARKAVAAAKARNADGVSDAGDAMYETCEGCHRIYMKK